MSLNLSYTNRAAQAVFSQIDSTQPDVLLLQEVGLGYRLGIYYEQFRIAPMYAIIVIIFALAAAANVGMTRLQDRVNRHMAPTTAKGKRGRPSASGNLGVVATN